MKLKFWITKRDDVAVYVYPRHPESKICGLRPQPFIMKNTGLEIEQGEVKEIEFVDVQSLIESEPITGTNHDDLANKLIMKWHHIFGGTFSGEPSDDIRNLAQDAYNLGYHIATEPIRESCEWTYQDGSWDHKCNGGFPFDINEGYNLTFKFCPFCGKPISVKNNEVENG